MSGTNIPRRLVVESNGIVLFAGDDAVTFGSRTGADVVVEDTVVADRHCRIAFEGAFHLRDLGSVTGTWLDGKRAAAFSEVVDGSEIVIGTTRLVAKITKNGTLPTLTLELQRGAFWWKKPGKGVFDNDPDAMVRAEVGFGRFPALAITNRIAAIAAGVLLIAGLLFAAIFEPLVDAGPLVPAHAFVRTVAADAKDVHASVAKCAAIAREQGCNACHEKGNGTPQHKCMQCHETMQSGRRHPFVTKSQLGALPGIDSGDAFCSTCHRDHQGSDFLKSRSHDLVGKCEACHAIAGATFDRDALLAKVQAPRVDVRDRAFATIAFPHDKHADPAMRCDLCHRPDAASLAARAKGLDDPDRHDFADVPFETCASCHATDWPAIAGMTTAEQAAWRDKTKAKGQYQNVTWHGTDDPNSKCAACHASAQRDGVTVHGPELKTTERPVDTAESYAANRATFVAGRRMHDDEFHAHAGGKQCLECHVRGSLVAAGAPRAAVFWHALHLASTVLTPSAGNAGAASLDDHAGCLSCHGDRMRSDTLRAANDGAYAWPKTTDAQKTCATCHSDGDQANAMTATEHPVPADQRRTTVAFPHDAHVRTGANAKFGVPGTTLADGCFSCHEFATPKGGSPMQAVPRTKAAVADCTQCHAHHAEIGGGACATCHPAASARDVATSFTLAAHAPNAKAPTRQWPAANGFSHSSPGHSGLDLTGKPITCAVCHDETATRASKTVADVPIPNESQRACRECHLQRQFHWR